MDSHGNKVMRPGVLTPGNACANQFVRLIIHMQVRLFPKSLCVGARWHFIRKAAPHLVRLGCLMPLRIGKMIWESKLGTGRSATCSYLSLRVTGDGDKCQVWRCLRNLRVFRTDWTFLMTVPWRLKWTVSEKSHSADASEAFKNYSGDLL